MKALRTWTLSQFICILAMLITSPVLRADTDDVIDDFLPAATGVYWCGGYAGAVWADLDEDGTYDTQVVFTTQEVAGDAGEAGVFTDDPDGKWYFFSFIDGHCGGAAPYTGRGRFTIHFVDILASGFVWNVPSTWTYKSIPGVSLRMSHDACYDYSGSAIPYQKAQAYAERFQTDPIAPTAEVDIGGWTNYRFGDAAGIKELYISTDFCENVLDDLKLHESPEFPDDLAGRPGLALLFDTSGSMNWNHEGDSGVPDDEKRLTHAKDAAIPFLQMLDDYAGDESDFAIARFPIQPTGSCTGQVITPMTEVTDSNISTAIDTTIPNLTATGSTPLLSGLSTALGTFTSDQEMRAVVLLSDGYHNCPGLVAPEDSEVTEAIANAKSAGARVYTIGFGRPDDVDHPLLETLAVETNGEFYDVTEPGFDPDSWEPTTALHAAYVEVLSSALALDLGEDPRGTIKAGEQITRNIPICDHDRTVTFYLSWATRQANRLGFKVFASDGTEVKRSVPGVRMHNGTTYKIITVKKAFLTQKGKVGPDPWRVEIDAAKLANPGLERFQYTVLMDSDLSMKVNLDSDSIFAGGPLTVTAKLNVAGVPLTGLQDVYARVSRPEVSLGNWFASNKVSVEELSRIPARIGKELLPDSLRKSRFLVDVRKIPRPMRVESSRMRLFDDGTHGDAVAEDGVYTSVYNDCQTEGSYAFHVRAKGEAGSCSFQREARFDRYVRVRVAPASLAAIHSEKLISYTKDIDRFRLTVTPTDLLGNALGPRRAKQVQIRPTWGRVVGDIEDNLDGSYSQIIETPRNLQQPLEFHIRVGDLNVSATATTGKTDEPIPTLRQQREQMKKDSISIPVTIHGR